MASPGKSSPGKPKPPHCQLRADINLIKKTKDDLELQLAAMATYALEPNGQNAVLRGSKTIRSNLDRDVRAILEALEETLRATQQLNGQKNFLERKVSTLELDKRRLQAHINKVESEKKALQQTVAALCPEEMEL